MGISPFLLSNCTNLEIKKPTQIQIKTIPLIIKGINVLACAKTGSGKTAAFALPILNELSKDPFGVFALVITPTRELAYQISEQFSVFGAKTGLTQMVICGGQDETKQKQKLFEKPHIVIATPGRLSKLFQTCENLPFNFLSYLVLDEADRLFEDSFLPDLSKIISGLPSAKKRQTLLFSATKNARFQYIREKFANDIKFSYAEVEELTPAAVVDSLLGYYLLVPRVVKECYLVHLLEKHFSEKNVIVFVARKKICELLTETLVQLGISAVELHSNISQAKRLAALGKFRARKSKALVCTDLASRGLDIPDVDVVINFNVPLRPNDYIHRVGRTARANKSGIAITLVNQYEVKVFKQIETFVGKKIELYEKIGNEEEVLNNLRMVSNAKKLAILRRAEYELNN